MYVSTKCHPAVKEWWSEKEESHGHQSHETSLGEDECLCKMSRMLSILRYFSETQVGRLDNLTLPIKEQSKGRVQFSLSRCLIIVQSVISTILYSYITCLLWRIGLTFFICLVVSQIEQRHKVDLLADVITALAVCRPVECTKITIKMSNNMLRAAF